MKDDCYSFLSVMVLFKKYIYIFIVFLGYVVYVIILLTSILCLIGKDGHWKGILILFSLRAKTVSYILQLYSKWKLIILKYAFIFVFTDIVTLLWLVFLPKKM